MLVTVEGVSVFTLVWLVTGARAPVSFAAAEGKKARGWTAAAGAGIEVEETAGGGVG